YRSELKRWRKRYTLHQQAMRHGDTTLTQTDSDLSVISSLAGRLASLRHQLNQARHDFNDLLRVQPAVKVVLSGTNTLPDISDVDFKNAVRELPRRRPDLLALQAGYHNKEEQ